jgi:hypothetical protein
VYALLDVPVDLPRATCAVSRAFLGTPLGPKNELFLFSAAQNVSNVFDFETCTAYLIGPSSGNTTVCHSMKVCKANGGIRSSNDGPSVERTHETDIELSILGEISACS